ncbi:response regulator [Pseudoduganella sp. FT25W]|uniref:Response regulator n=1 Tax=Duganella alba TaxID=2666081 RepID=A0A6L5QCZ9_9BURK|nr:response regulator [Duganella alba]MRX07152.1 response regulator [Duganella alba]MRX15153.1 response regulator [Duganella alba]
MASQYPPKRVLIVDDNRDAADLTAELLGLHGHVTATAYGGREGINRAVEFVPDVVLLDLGMPVVDGFAVAIALRQIRALDRAVLVAYTAWNDTATRNRTIASGFDSHVVKPAKLEMILDMVDRTRRDDM